MKTSAPIYAILGKYGMTGTGINVSSSFGARARCKGCGTDPTWHYTQAGSQAREENVQSFSDTSQRSRKYISRMAFDTHEIFGSDPRYFRASEMDFKLRGRAYLPVCHHSRKPLRHYVDRIVDVFACECGKTAWVSKNTSRTSPEIRNRKGRYNYPKNFDFDF